MKFAKELERDLVPEWRAKYLDYKVGKKKVKAVSRAVSHVDRSPLSPWRTSTVLSSRSRATPQTLLRQSVSQGDLPRAHTNASTVPPTADASTNLLENESGGAARTYGGLDRDRNSRSSQGSGARNTPHLTRYGSILGSPPQSPKDQGQTPNAEPSAIKNEEELARAPTLELPAAAMSSQPANNTRPTLDTRNTRRAVDWSPHPDRVIPSGGAQQRKHSLAGYKGILERFKSNSADNVSPLNKRVLSLRNRTGTGLSPGGRDVQLQDYRELDMRQAEFFKYLDGELDKIETFYKEKEDEATNRLNILREQLHIMRDRRLDEIVAAEEAKRKSKWKSHEGNGFPHHSGELGISNDKSSGDSSALDGTYLPKPLTSALSKARQNGLDKTSRALKSLAIPGLDHARRLDNRRDYTRRPEAPDIPHRTAKRKLKAALQELYRGLELLKSYALLNRTAFRKINKKYDKAINARPPLRFMSERVNQSWFVQSDVLDGHMVAVEDLYARYFEKGNHKIAVGKLRVKSLRQGAYSDSAFWNGLTLAAGLVFGIQGVVFASQLLYDPDPALALNTSYLLQIYGGYFLMLLLILLFCLDCRIWSFSKINYVFVFEFDTRHHLDWRQLSELPCFASLLLGFFMWLNFGRYGSDALYIYYPAVLIGITVILLFLPAPTLHHRMRTWFLYSNWRLLLSGFYPVEFRDFFLGDMFCSQTYSMGNIEIFFCLYAHLWSNPSQCNSSHSRWLGFLTTLPGIWRALQCIRRYADTRNIFPHLVNCGKYGFTILYYMSLSLYRMNHATGYQAFFIFCATVNAIYCSIWDVIMDWSLGDPYANHKFLRDTLGYKQVWFYYMAMVVDPILRFNWIFYAIFAHDTQHSALLSFVVSLSEVLRRGMWTLIRVENEHCTNVGRFRALRDLPLPYDMASAAGSDVASPEMTGQAPTQDSAVPGQRSSPAVASIRAPHTPRTFTADTPSATGTGVDLERQASQGTFRGYTRRRRSTVTASPLINRVGTLLHSAHAQDFERRRKPETSKVGEEAEQSSDDEDDEEDAQQAEGLLERAREHEERAGSVQATGSRPSP